MITALRLVNSAKRMLLLLLLVAEVAFLGETTTTAVPDEVSAIENEIKEGCEILRSRFPLYETVAWANTEIQFIEGTLNATAGSE